MERTDIVNASGNDRFIIQGLNAEKTAYLEDALQMRGLVSFDMTFTQEETPYPGDEDPEYIIDRKAPTGSGTATPRGISPEIYEKIYAAISGANGVWFGEDLPVKRFGISIDEKITIDGEESINRWVVFNCRATNLPSLATKALERRDMPIALSAAPIFYKKANGRKGRAIFTVFNNVLHKTAFDMFENGIIMPTEALINGTPA